METSRLSKNFRIVFDILIGLVVVTVFAFMLFSYADTSAGSSNSFLSNLSNPIFSFFGKINPITSKDSDSQSAKQIRARYESYVAALTDQRLPMLTSSTDSFLPDEPVGILSVPILTYHAVLPEQQGEDHSQAEFEEHMFALKAAGYETIRLQDYHDFMSGLVTLPKKSFLLTFDDGRKHTYYPVDPYLEALDYSAVMYVITGHLLSGETNSYYMDKTEMQKAKESGRWELESHGRFDHDPIVVGLSGETDLFVPNRQWIFAENRLETAYEHEERLRHDLLQAKSDIERYFGHTPISYAIPRGDFGSDRETQEMVTAVIKSVYDINFFQVRPDLTTGYYTQNYVGLDDMGLSRRIKAPLNVGGDGLIRIIESGNPKSLPYIARFNEPFQWIEDSSLDPGIVAGGVLNLTSDENSTGAHVYLDGTRHWGDYEVSVGAKLEKGKSYKLLARAVTGEQYVACVYYLDRVRLQHMDGGVESLIAENRQIHSNPYNDHRAGIRVSGRVTTCLLDGQVVLQSILPESLPKNGGIGLKIWDPIPGNGSVVVNDLTVHAL